MNFSTSWTFWSPTQLWVGGQRQQQMIMFATTGKDPSWLNTHTLKTSYVSEPLTKAFYTITLMDVHFIIANSSLIGKQHHINHYCCYSTCTYACDWLSLATATLLLTKQSNVLVHTRV